MPFLSHGKTTTLEYVGKTEIILTNCRNRETVFKSFGKLEDHNDNKKSQEENQSFFFVLCVFIENQRISKLEKVSCSHGKLKNYSM